MISLSCFCCRAEVVGHALAQGSRGDSTRDGGSECLPSLTGQSPARPAPPPIIPRPAAPALPPCSARDVARDARGTLADAEASVWLAFESFQT